MRIPDAQHAGKVWLAFSRTAWTPALFEKHKQEAERKRHMQVIDVKAWVAGSAPQPHVAPLGEVAQRVSEYHIPPAQVGQAKDAYKAFAHTLEGMTSLSAQSEKLLRDATAAGATWGYPPAMIAVPDPVGIAADLAGLMRRDLQEEITQRKKGQARALAVSSAIGNIRKVIEEDAENRQIYRSEVQAMQARYPGEAGAGVALAEIIFPRLRQENDALYERWRDPTPAQMEEARKDAWDKYTKKLKNNGKDRDTWQNDWNQSMAAYDQAIIVPLAQAHVQWMESQALFEHLDCNHDDRDAHSGKSFVDTMLSCIQDTQQCGPCSNLYERWLSATQIDKKNLILRALGVNQKTVLDQIDKAAHGGLDPDSLKGLPWDGLISGYDKAVEAVRAGANNSVVRFTAALGGVFAKVAQKAVDGVVGPALVAAGVIAKAPVLMADVVMTKEQAIAELVARATQINGKIANLKDLNRAIEIQMRKAKIYGTPLKGTGKFRYLILADPKVAEDFPGVDAKGAARKFAQSALLTEEDWKSMTQLRWRKLMPASAGLGVITGILQLVALGKLADDLDKSMAHEKTENLRRYFTAWTGFVGTLSDTFGKWSESAATTGSKVGQAIERYLGKALRIAGKGLGILAGAVMAVWDFYRGVQEAMEGNGWVGALFIASSFASGMAILAFSETFGALIFGAAATGVGIALVVFVIVIAVFIEIFKDNKIQDWMERCYFGKFADKDKYQEIEPEMKELDMALAG